ncbi:la-related protein Larp4B-like, partial [Anopheles albimanus]|uniref:la-related protein Larp4B-like n=1 Tax=Anopheles albimanus TaxID=7167 RepID=UPI00163FE9B2
FVNFSSNLFLYNFPFGFDFFLSPFVLFRFFNISSARQSANGVEELLHAHHHHHHHQQQQQQQQQQQLQQLSASGLEPMASDADLVLSTLRHQRDLFSGPLGIPDVTTRVGSVIHAFETMARQRQTLAAGSAGRTEKPYDAAATIAGGSAKYRSHRSNVKRVGADTMNRHKIILPSPNLSPASSAEVHDPGASGGLYHPLHPLATAPDGLSQSNFPSQQHQQYHLASSAPRQTQPFHHHHHHLPPSSFSYTDPLGTGLRRHTNPGDGRLMAVGGADTHNIDNNNTEQSSAQPGHGGQQQQHHQHRGVPVLPFSAFGPHGHSSAVGSGAGSLQQPQHYQPGHENESSNFDSLNLDDDYRKSSFGKQSKLLQHQQHQHQQQQRQPSSSLAIDTVPSVARNQFTGAGGTSGSSRPTNRGLWSLFGGSSGPPVPEHASSPATTGYSSSRNNPNVFFNASPSSSALPTTIPSVVTTSPPTVTTSTNTTTTTSTSNGSTTMRYYNLDNNSNTNGANRRSAVLRPHRAGEQQQQQESQFLPDSLDDALVSIERYGDFDADNELDDGQAANAGASAAGDKFLRGSTVSQSFIKNVRIMRKKSSSYDVNTPNGGTGTTMATAIRGSQRGKRVEQVDGGAATASNSFRQRGSQMMAAAAKHFTKRNRAPSVPVAPSSAGTVADNDGLTGPADDGIDEPGADGEVDRSNVVSPAATGQSATRAGSGKRRLFQPRTMDRAEI